MDKREWCCHHKGLACPHTSPYDCRAGYSNWRAEWSVAKKEYCCSHGGRGCSDEGIFDCHAGFMNWRNGWSLAKKEWCCHHKGVACMHDEHRPIYRKFDASKQHLKRVSVPTSIPMVLMAACLMT